MEYEETQQSIYTEWQNPIILIINNELQDLTNQALVEPGQYFEELREVSENMLTESHTQLTDEKLEHLLALAHERMRFTQSSSALFQWRRLYTDSCILKALLAHSITTASQAIYTLDHAIIIAGAAGNGRLDLILSLIEKLQSICFSDCQPQVNACVTHKELPIFKETTPSAARPIPCISTPPSFLSFQSTFSRHPFILRGYARDWPAMREHPWSSAGYLLSVSGRGRLVPVEVGHDYRREDWQQILMSWEEFLENLDFYDRPAIRKAQNQLYLAQHNLMMQFPALRDDIVIPDYVYASLSPEDGSRYKPPENLDSLLLNTWIGPKNTVSPAHTDPYHNLFVQIFGRKAIWIAPPHVSSSMSPTPLIRQSSQHAPVGHITDSDTLQCNNSNIDVFLPIDDQHQGFLDNVVPHAMTAVLGPSDLLFLPPGWWHAMKSEDTSCSVSMWF